MQICACFLIRQVCVCVYRCVCTGVCVHMYVFFLIRQVCEGMCTLPYKTGVCVQVWSAGECMYEGVYMCVEVCTVFLLRQLCVCAHRCV